MRKEIIDCSKTENYFAEKRRMTKKHKLKNCGGQFVGNGLLNYCYNCGQKLDWR
jgi:hypothetical protein